MASSGQTQQRWTEERVARELEAWFAQRAIEQWPPYRTFVADGRKRLHAQLMGYGGPQRWAAELGVPLVRRHSGPQHNDAEIRDSLRALLREHRPQRFPSDRWLREHGPPGLAPAVTYTGGGQRWAGELGIPGPRPPRWTDELIDRELRLLCVGKTHWPTTDEFAKAGQRRLLLAIYRGHGTQWWAQRLGLPQRRRSRSRRVPTQSRPAPATSSPPRG
jgi:hypothetical protein